MSHHTDYDLDIWLILQLTTYMGVRFTWVSTGQAEQKKQWDGMKTIVRVPISPATPQSTALTELAPAATKASVSVAER